MFHNCIVESGFNSKGSVYVCLWGRFERFSKILEQAGNNIVCE